jgi:hypothetical protein
MRWLRLSLILAAIATAYCFRLGQPLLWSDEADTGILARNVLRFGYPTAFDGRNVSLADDGAQLNRSLLSRKIPWVQYYVGALSLAVFGNDTAGLRMLFALLGLAAFFPIRAALRGRVRQPDLLAALALLAPQVVLLQRNARYYSLLILLYALLVWHLSASWQSRKARWSTATLIFVLFFHTHPFAACCSACALILYCLGLRREDLPGYFLAAAIGFLSWLAWYELLGPSLASAPLTLSLLVSNFQLWWLGFSLGSAATAIDLDAVGCVPTLALAAALAYLWWRRRPALRELARQPLPTFVLLNLVVQALATGAVFGPETGLRLAILRYMPHLLVFALLASFVVLDSAVRSRSAILLLCGVAVATNLLGLSHWTAPWGRKVPASWAGPVYGEILQPPDRAWNGVVDRLRAEAAAPAHRSDVMVVWPPWNNEVMIFYLGDLALIRQSTLTPVPTAANRLVFEAIGAEASRRLSGPPSWIVDAVGILQTTPSQYVLDGVFPMHTADPYSSVRPELTRHAFAEAAPGGTMRIFRLSPQ